MSNTFSLADAENKIQDVNLPLLIKEAISNSHVSMRKFSAMVSGYENYLSQQLQRKNISLPLLYTVTMQLQVNMFEPLLQTLPEKVQVTKRETALEAENARLRAELADVQKERDIYKEIVLKRSGNSAS